METVLYAWGLLLLLLVVSTWALGGDEGLAKIPPTPTNDDELAWAQIEAAQEDLERDRWTRQDWNKAYISFVEQRPPGEVWEMQRATERVVRSLRYPSSENERP